MCQLIASHSDAFSEVANEPLRRFVNRCLLGIGLIGLWPFMVYMRMHSWESVGWGGFRGQVRFRLKEIFNGFIVGIGALMLFIMVSGFLGGRQFSWNWGDWLWARKILSALATALTVGLLEETLFRGGLFGGFSRFLKIHWALLISSMIYSILHFFAKPETPETVHWWSGWTTLVDMSQGFLDPQRAIPGFFNLLLGGGFLCWVYYQKRKLYWCFGIHAGWIFSLKMSRGFTIPQTNHHSWIWGGSQIIDGWGVLLAIALSWIFLYALWREPKKSTVS